MRSIPLHHVWEYNDIDRAFWDEHFEGWMPKRIIDAHSHIATPAFRLREVTEEMRRQYWVNELRLVMNAEDAEQCDRITFPGREVRRMALGVFGLDFDIEKCNEYLRAECHKRDWTCLFSLLPQWNAARIAHELDKPGVIGAKPYYTFISDDPTSRDKHIEASIFDYLPHHALEVLDDRGAWVTLHVPKADRLPHPDNIREIKEIRKRYPKIILVIAHFGRCYTEPHVREGLPPLADDPGLYFDCAAVFNPAVHRFALETIGPQRIIFGTDNPIFYMRGRRQWKGRTYFNRTNHPFHFNKKREAPEIEAKYTLYMYEGLKAIKDSCGQIGLGRKDVEAVMHDNASRLIKFIVDAKADGGCGS